MYDMKELRVKSKTYYLCPECDDGSETIKKGGKEMSRRKRMKLDNRRPTGRSIITQYDLDLEKTLIGVEKTNKKQQNLALLLAAVIMVVIFMGATYYLFMR